MLTSRRDYILRLIDEVGRMLNRALHQRRASGPEAALETIVHSCERLFGLEADKLFQFTPDQHIAMLIEGEPPEIARDKLLLYAALNAEAGRIYLQIGKRSLARGSTLNALRLCLRARLDYPATPLPIYAPDVAELRASLADEPLDPATAELLTAANLDNSSSPPSP
jgi:GAF domain-containing protein